MSQRFPHGLERYIPSQAIPTLEQWHFPTPFELHLTRGRKSKLGDHRPPHGKKGHRITVDHDLGPYTFLITLVHELAHLVTHEEHRDRRVHPHGKEWKLCFQRMMGPFLEPSIFPEPLLEVLKEHMKNPKASLYADERLLNALRDLEDPDGLTLSELPRGSRFMLDKGWVMEKGKRLRTRFRCQRIGTSRIYLVNGAARVKPVHDKDG